MAKNKELKDTGYELFILLLSIVSVFNLAIAFIARFVIVDPNTLGVITIIDEILTVFFIVDFTYRILTTESKSNYFFKNWGWADLLACIPFLRIFRLFRVVRAIRLMREFGLKNMINEVMNNRAGSALYITIFSIIIISEFVGVLILKAESISPDANITTAGDSVWWTLVTMTTVGYGDTYPVTAAGRVMGIFVMFSGVALIGVLASYLSSFFLAPKSKSKGEDSISGSPKAQLQEMKKMLDDQLEANEALKTKLERLEESL